MKPQMVAGLGAVLALIGCAAPDPSSSRASGAKEANSPLPSDTRTEHPGSSRPDTSERTVVEYMTVRRVGDRATKDFVRVTEATLEDPRGWRRAGFDLVRKTTARYRIVLAEGPVVDKLCLPYETHSTYSCQNGPVVALNADRWRFATRKWTGTRSAYRKMLVNHEVGHLLGQHHPAVQCPKPGHLAPIMAQQSTELNGCLPNPWPLPGEIERAAKRDLPLAPPFDG